MKRILFTSSCVAALMNILTAQTTEKVTFTTPVIKKNVWPKAEVVQFTPPKIVKSKQIKKHSNYPSKRRSTKKVKKPVYFVEPVILPGKIIGNKG